MRTDSALAPGLSDTNGEGEGELALDREGRSGGVEQAPRATRSAARVKGQTRRGGRCPDTPRTVSVSAGFAGYGPARCQAAVASSRSRQLRGQVPSTIPAYRSTDRRIASGALDMITSLSQPAYRRSKRCLSARSATSRTSAAESGMRFG
jgi:hypothetical protein